MRYDPVNRQWAMCIAPAARASRLVAERPRYSGPDQDVRHYSNAVVQGHPSGP